MNAMCSSISRVLRLIRRGEDRRSRGIKQMQEAMHIFEVLELPEQVAYYQEHFDKFVKYNFPNMGKIKNLLHS